MKLPVRRGRRGLPLLSAGVLTAALSVAAMSTATVSVSAVPTPAASTAAPPTREALLAQLATLKAERVVRVVLCPDGQRFTLGAVRPGLSPKLNVTPANSADPDPTSTPAGSPAQAAPQGFVQVQQGESRSLSVFALIGGQPRALACAAVGGQQALFVASDVAGGVQVTRLNVRTRAVDWEVISASGDARAADIAVDGRGQPFVLSTVQAALPVGTDTRPPKRKVLVQRLNTAGQVLWNRQLSSAGQDAEDWAGRIALQGQNAVWVAGQTTGWFETRPPAESALRANAGQQDIFLARLESGQGSVISQAQFGSPQNDVVQALLTTPSSVWLGGHTYGALAGQSGGDADAFVARFNNLGQTHWLQQFAAPGAAGFTALAWLPDGHILAAGSSDETLQTSGLTQLFDDSGQVLARALLTRGTPVGIADLAADRSGGVYLGGVAGGGALFAQLDGQLRPVWTLPFEDLNEHLGPEPTAP